MNEAASTPTGRPVPNGAVQDDAVRDGAVRGGAAQDGPGDQEAAEGAPQHSPALEVRGLTKRFGDTVAVAGLDLCMARGSVLALLGPNGAGKTTTVEIYEGFQRPDGGTVRVLGMDPAAQGERLRPRIGVMPQGGGAYPGVRAAEMLRLIASCAADPIDPDWLLDTLGLAAAGRTPYKRLSGGQQQRLSLACALVGRPELVFLDEPTAGLDPQARRLVWDLVAALRRDGVGVLLTTHLMDEAEALADRVVIVDHGRAVADGTAAELTADPQGRQELWFRSETALDLTCCWRRCRRTTRPPRSAPGSTWCAAASTRRWSPP